MSSQTTRPLLETSRTRGPGRPVALHQTPPPPGQVTFHRVQQLQPVSHSHTNASHIQTVPPPFMGQHERDTISLENVKPVHARNEYVDSPAADPCTKHLVELPLKDTSKSPNNNHLGLAIVTQPSQTLKKPESSNEQCTDSIYCSNCRKCKCAACTTPRELPRKWICDGKQEVSLQCCVDTCTCLCLVKLCFQSCFNYLDREEDRVTASDNPCGCCEQTHCCKRWACMAGMALACPTLLLYPFCQLGLLACTGCYNCCTRRGCRCRRGCASGRQLLVESESSST